MSHLSNPDNGPTAIHTRTGRNDRVTRLRSNAARLFSGTTMAGLIGLVSFALTARTLGAHDFGVLVLVVAFASVVSRLCGFQTWQALIKYAADFDSRGQRERTSALIRVGFYVDIGACILAAAVVYFGTPVARAAFQWPESAEAAARMYALAVLFSIEGTPTGIIRYLGRFDLLAWHPVLSAGAKLLMVLAAWMTQASFQGMLWAWIAGQILSHVLIVGFAVRALVSRGIGLRKGTAHARDVVSWPFVRFLVATNMDSSLRIVRELDVQIVALYLDASAVAILRVARQLAGFAFKLVDAFYIAIYPNLAELSAERRWADLRHLVGRSSIQVGLLALCGLLVFVLVGGELVTLIFGEAYAGAFLPAAILLLSTTIWGFAQPLAPALMSMGMIGRVFLIHILATCAYLALLFGLVPAFSVAGAAWSMVGLYLVWASAAFVAYRFSVPLAPRT